MHLLTVQNQLIFPTFHGDLVGHHFLILESVDERSVWLDLYQCRHGKAQPLDPRIWLKNPGSCRVLDSGKYFWESWKDNDSYVKLDGLNWTETETANRRIDIFYVEMAKKTRSFQGSMRFFVSFCGAFFSLDPWEKYNDLYHSQLYHRLGQLLYLMISSALIRDITDSISKTVCYIYLVFFPKCRGRQKKTHFAILFEFSDFNPFGSGLKLNWFSKMLVPQHAWCKTHFTIQTNDRNLKIYEHLCCFNLKPSEKYRVLFESMMPIWCHEVLWD